MTPFQALQHPWILEGLPHKVLIHHQRMLGLDVPSESSQTSLPQHHSSSQQPNLVTEENREGLHHRSSGWDQATPFDHHQISNYNDDEIEESFQQELLDVHNRSTQIQQEQQMQPARVLDNGIVHQLRVESGAQHQQEA